jgi:hypothetical protein
LVDFGWRFPRESRWKNVEIPTVSETFSVGRLGALGVDAALQFLSRSFAVGRALDDLFAQLVKRNQSVTVDAQIRRIWRSGPETRSN